ncbi:helix-turn-helix transcriptional regulator [Modestobacter muralis]|uniref:Helix-turn-helix transcriptional regulator n=1 Tax=Modestobacter muralis TaxID=1608614 RepID=A0A6P0HAF5_9ACTN|nr:helix-turn-helix transcriptional regulator [Modestobacter muralis]NEK94236.1 helix-turn-helix transcriptional regulator [Modestobacter muralis]NEN51004.1 helix-turn-helix transcriptional regulator [Modestobacter muralis]
MPTDRAALGAFLRSRRDRLSPAQAGMAAFPGARRVPGLRKEELAVLAGLSPDYYSRLEQGRQANVSDEVLDALARALRLDEVEHAHLRDLAAPTRRRRATASVPQRADPGLLRLMTGLDHLPALVLGQRGEVLASNALLTAVLGHAFDPGSSLLRWLFLDPLARERIVNWAQFAMASVGALRRDAARHPDDVRLHALIEDLRAADPDVARWWDDQGVRDYASVPKRIQHPVAGPLSFDIELVSAPHDLDQRLIVYTAEPGSLTARQLPLLASWGATAPAPAG